MPTRDRYTIKTEIDEAQHDLERNLHELRSVVSDKVDVKARLKAKVDERKDQALDAAVRVREIGLDVSARARAFVREHPAAIIGAVAGIAVVTGLVLKIRRELQEPEELVVFEELRYTPSELVELIERGDRLA